MDRLSGALRALLAILLVGGLIVAGPIAIAADGEQSGDSGGAKTYSLQELRSGGEQVSGAAPSLRWIGDDSAVYLDRPYTNPLRGGGGEEWQVEALLKPGEKVTSNQIRMHYQGPRDASNRTITVHIVYWELGTRQLETENGTTTEQIAVNQTHDTQRVTFPSSFTTQTLDLRSHYDRPVRVTMWIEGQEETARWTFVHHSLETSRAVTTKTAGERLWWLIREYVVWLVLGGLIAGAGSLWAIRRAGAGPQMGFLTWAFLIGIGAFVAILTSYEGLASLFVTAPKVLAATTVALLTIPWIEGQDDRLRKYLFVKPVVTEAVSASGAEARDALYLELAEHRVTELADGTLSVVKPGLFKFVARLLGGTAPLIGASEMGQTEVRANGSTRHDRVVWIRPSSEQILDYKPEGISLQRPPQEALALAAGALLTLVGNAWLGGATAVNWLAYLALLAVAITGIKIRTGYAKVDPATAHMRSAHVTTMLAGKEIADAETLDDARKEAYKERAKSSKDVEDVVELRDDTLIKEMLGVDVTAGVSDVDEPEPEEREVSSDD